LFGASLRLRLDVVLGVGDELLGLLLTGDECEDADDVLADAEELRARTEPVGRSRLRIDREHQRFRRMK
jgi:hypothetical protein